MQTASLASWILRWPGWWRVLVVTAIGFSVLVLSLPSILCYSGVLESLLNRQLANRQLRASIGNVQIGWLTPTQLDDVAIGDEQRQWRLQAAQISGSQTLWQLFASPGALGRFVLEEPTLIVEIGQPMELPEVMPGSASSDTPSDQSLDLTIRNGRVLVVTPDRVEPSVFASQIHIDASWRKTADGKTLTLAAGKPMDRVQLTPEMCDLGLKFVAPIFADVAWSRGDLSLELDRCQIEVDQIERSEVQGRITLHSVETGLRSPIAKSVAQALSAISKRELPQSVLLADNSVIEFQLQDGQVSHSGLEFGLPELSPDLVIHSHGTVGLDKSLDLMVEVPLPLNLLGDGPIATALGKQTLYLPVRGTLDQPEVKLEGDGQLVSNLLSGMLNPAMEGDLPLDEITEALKQLRERNQQRREERGPRFPRLRDRLRGRSSDAGPGSRK